MNLILGYGEIGQSVGEVIGPHWKIDPGRNLTDKPPLKIDVLHICFPPSDDFVQDVQLAIYKYDPAHVIIWSSTAIGTCAAIGDYVIHSPVEGKHPRLAESIRTMTRWVGCFDKEELDWATEYFNNLDLLVRPVEATEYTEALKLLSTTEYGINIVYAGYKKWVAETLGMDYELMKEWNESYNDLYLQLGMRQFQKFVLEPPEGIIGGHCIRPNAELLSKQFPSEFLRMIKEYK